MKKEKKNINWFVVVIVVICIMAMGGAITYGILSAIPGTTVINKQEKEVTVNENGIADAVEKVYDSVVVIEGYKNKKPYSSGTGFIYKKDGDKYNVITNYHVIDGCDGVKIRLTNGDSIDATLVGGNQYDDIAVLAIETKKDLKVASVGSSKNARIGDTVFAVGAPINSTVYSWTVTRGILSGKDRAVQVSTTNSMVADYEMRVLQTDTAINNGNSGGPLCNSNGEVIGITNMKLKITGVEGMGFAIPIEEAISYADKLINGEDTSKPYLGLSMADIAQASAAYYYYGITIPDNIENGVIILDVEAKSSADDAKLKKGDIIYELNGEEVKSVADLKYKIYKKSVGDKVEVKYYRNGKSESTTITLGKKKSE